MENMVTACCRCNRKKNAKVGIWPRKIVTVIETVTETETVTVMKNPVAGRWAMFIAVQVLVAGIIYGGFTQTNILIFSPVAAIIFLVGFVLLLIGV